MNPDPFSDVVAFVSDPRGMTIVFWLLVLASVLIAGRSCANSSTASSWTSIS